MTPVDVKAETYINGSLGFNTKKNLKYHVQIFKCKYIFSKDHRPKWREVFVIGEDTTYVTEDLNGKEIVGTF